MMKKYLILSVVIHIIVLTIIAYSTAKGQETKTGKEYEILLSYEKRTTLPKQTVKQRLNAEREAEDHITDLEPTERVPGFPLENIGVTFIFRKNGIKRFDSIERDNEQDKIRNGRFSSKDEIEDERTPATSSHVISEGEPDEFFVMPSIVVRDALATKDFKGSEGGEAESNRQAAKPTLQKASASQDKKQENVQIDMESIDNEKVREYIQKLNSHIGNFSYYPKLARKKEMQGKNMLNVLVDKKGVVKSIIIIHSSGSEILDDASVEVVKNASPFPAFPEGVNLESGWITLPFNYILK